MAPYIMMGFSSLLLQITALRELLTVFSGNELDVGITLSVWLLSVGAGSLIGERIGKGMWPFGASFIAVALLSEPTILMVKLIRPALSLVQGETVPLSATVLSTAIVLFPLCFVLGLQFPLATRSIKKGTVSPSVVYGLEAVGAFIAGILFTFVLSGRADAGAIALFVAVLNVLVALYILRRKVLIALIGLPLAIHIGLGSVEDSLWRSMKLGALLERAQSRYGEIWVTGLDGQRNLYSSGRLLFSYPDKQAEGLRTHLPMSVHSGTESVLVIGGSPASLREFLKYPLKRIDFVEMDPELLNVSLRLLSPSDRRAAEDERVRLITTDGRRYIKSVKGLSYDMAILNLSGPSTANANRFYTREFFLEAKGVLKEGGVLAMTLPASAGYVGRRMKESNGSIYNSLRSAFERVETTTEEYGGIFASDDRIETIPATLAQRWESRGIHTEYFHAYILQDAFMPLRTAFHRMRLEEAKTLNTDMRPSTYLFNLMLWAEAAGGTGGRALNKIIDYGWLLPVSVFAVFVIAGSLSLGKKRRTLYYSIFTTGYWGMAVSLAILLGFQSSFGYLYGKVGLLAALFMAGIAVGSGRRTPPPLFFLEITFAVFSLIAALFFKNEVLFYMLSFFAGALSGAGFRAVSLGDAKAGTIYGLDLAGAFFGSILTAVFFVPMFGIWLTLMMVSAVKLLSAALVFMARHEKD